MPTYCGVYSCKTKYLPKSDEKFHYLPKNKELKKLWVHALKFKKEPSKYTRICSNHFLKSDYNTTSLGKCKFLKSSAVPTQNLPMTSVEKLLKKKELEYRRKFKVNQREKSTENKSLNEQQEPKSLVLKTYSNKKIVVPVAVAVPDDDNVMNDIISDQDIDFAFEEYVTAEPVADLGEDNKTTVADELNMEINYNCQKNDITPDMNSKIEIKRISVSTQTSLISDLLCFSKLSSNEIKYFTGFNITRFNIIFDMLEKFNPIMESCTKNGIMELYKKR